MRIESCNFCGTKIYPLQGILFVKNNMRRHLFCTSKCINYFEKNKNPRHFKWTKTYRILNNKEPIKESETLWKASKFTSIRYNRENILKALKLIKTVTKARAARKFRFTLKNKLQVRMHEKAILRKRFNELVNKLKISNVTEKVELKEDEVTELKPFKVKDKRKIKIKN